MGGKAKFIADTRISSDKAFDKTSDFIIRGCLALGVIQSNPPVPKFYAEAHEAVSLRLLSWIITHNGHEGPHHQGTHTGASIQMCDAINFVWP